MEYRYNIRENNVVVEPSNFASVVQTAHAEDVSEKYRFIPTFEVLNMLEKEGWKPTSIREARVLDSNNNGFQKHIVMLNDNQRK